MLMLCVCVCVCFGAHASVHLACCTFLISRASGFSLVYSPEGLSSIPSLVTFHILTEGRQEEGGEEDGRGRKKGGRKEGR